MHVAQGASSPAPPTAVLESKLNPPTARSWQIRRSHLRERFHGSNAKLVLIWAPAGFGKTTAMSQCMAELQANGVDTAWLTLDQADNDVSRFLYSLEAAVARLTGDPCRPDHSEDDSRSAGETALQLMARLADDTPAFALFLDDFERIQDPSVRGLVREIIDHLPRRGQLVIGSRSLPDLGLGRLRARGQLLEIDAAQLRFSKKETADFLLERRRLPLTETDLARIHDKTEGWVTALWLASLAMEDHPEPGAFIDRFSGASQTVAEYLAEDVLARQPPEVRRFLLRTSILHHLSAPLCDALVPGTHSETLLRRLDASNLFLTPMEGEERIYRYHSLFADFLRARLAEEMPDEVPRLHRAASDWYESQGRPVPAIDHALEGHNFDRALRLLSEHADRLLSQGRMRLLARWFQALPEHLLRRRPRLQVARVWALCFTHAPHETLQVLRDTGLEASADPEIRAHVRAIRPLLLAITDRFEEAQEAGRRGLTDLPTPAPFADMALINAMANVYSVMGEYAQARQLLDSARDAQGTHESAFNVMYSESIDGIIDLQEGRQRQAAARFRLAVGATRRATAFSHINANAWAGVLHASAVYEANQPGQAARLLNVYVPMAKDVGLADHMLLGDVMLARIAFHDGDVDRAFQILTGLEHMGYVRQLPRVVATTRLERARLLLMQGRGMAARDELDRADIGDVWERIAPLRLPANDLEYLQMGRWRWEIHSGRPETVCEPLRHALEDARAATRYRRALKLQLLLAIAHHHAGHAGEAMAAIGELLETACAEGYLRLIVDEGPAAGSVIMQFRNGSGQGGAGRSDPILAEYVERLLEAFGPAVTDVPAEPRQGLLEPLTRKEIQVLQLLAEGYSNSAMAEKLFVSDSTVRTHLRNINAKLSAASRTQAVAIARRVGVI